MCCFQPRHARPIQSGYSMLEVLISVLILSMGLLGMAALQTTSLRFNHEAHLQSVALVQVYAMADRMRANQAGVNAGNYNALSGTPTNPSCTTCSPAETATRDLFDWNSSNAAFLPNGQGTVTANGNLFNVIIRYDKGKTGATGTNCSGNPQVDLTCLSMSVDI